MFVFVYIGKMQIIQIIHLQCFKENLPTPTCQTTEMHVAVLPSKLRQTKYNITYMIMLNNTYTIYLTKEAIMRTSQEKLLSHYITKII